jgi:hypothetical protein
VATTTPRIGLTKPDGTDLVDVAVLNTNFDKIDSNIASTKIQATKPTTANAGDLWWDSNTGTLYLYYVDANSAQWVAATSDPVNIGVVANQSERDAQYPTPGQGMRVYRTDLGVTQTYYGLFNASTNPGGRAVAGWYDTENSVGLVPVTPTSIVPVGSGSSASLNPLGLISFSSCASIQLAGIFSSRFRNYKIIIDGLKNGPTVNDGTFFQIGNGTTFQNANYSGGMNGIESGYSATSVLTNSGQVWLNYHRLSGINSLYDVTISKPFLAENTTFLQHSQGFSPGNAYSYGYGASVHQVSSSYSALLFGVTGGSVSGTIQVFGYNN